MKKSIIAVTTGFLKENGIPFDTKKKDKVTTVSLLGTPLSLEFHDKQKKPHNYNGRLFYASIPECVVFNGESERIALPNTCESVMGELHKSLIINV